MRVTARLSCRISWLFLLFLVCGREAIAQTVQRAPAKNSLWRITTNKSTLYLLGSIHMMKPDVFPLSDAIEEAFRSSARLVLEVNLDGLNSPDAQQAMLAKGLLPEGKRLGQVLSPETYRQVQQKVEALQLNIGAISRMKPWFLSLALAAMKMQQLGYNPENGVDRYFFGKAINAKKPVVGLETADFQISLLDSLPAKTQEEALLQTLNELDQFEKEIEQVVRAWKAGREKELESLLLESFKEYPEVYAKIVTDRNRNWLAALESHLRGEGSTFVVVGAAHLVGRDGVVELLRKRGYSVEQQ